MADQDGRKRARAAALLLVASLLWGMSFAAQSAGMEYIGPFTFIGIRSLLGGVGLFVAVFFVELLGGKKPYDKRRTIKAGVILGLVLTVGSNLQQLGLVETTAGKAGFITSLYIVFVPLFGLVVGKRAHPMVWLCALIALAGLYFLSMGDGASLNCGDMLVLGCAVVYAVHILLIDRFARDVDVMRMSGIQFLVTGVLSLIPALLFEEPTLGAISNAWLTLVYVGLISGSVCYTIQMFAQRSLEPTVASLLLSPESVFAALGGWILLGETLTAREQFGCALVFLAVLCSLLPWKTMFRRTKKADAAHPLPESMSSRQA